ncbi:lipopolysaccharide biosynthesis protein [Thiocystis violacea]|uniref:lipopolysaccharide biosynthesis protein n=1 Tax=Thiocystis violacea TaxID=13725 RepID=UPI0019053942|nr:lipopolysaccharide biosynthesis protein [Thiocystis violacea]MBK1725025.1 hypothetical protein [Thiocystis violacea]
MLKKIASLLGGNLIFAGSQWLILVALTKFVGLTAAGVYALSLAIVSPVYTLAGLDLRSVAATDISEENDPRDFLLLTVAGNVVALIASIVIAMTAFPPESIDMSVLFALALAKTIETFTFVQYGFLQRAGWIIEVSRSLAARGLLGLGVFSALLGLSGAYQVALYGLALSWGIVLIWSAGRRSVEWPRSAFAGETGAGRPGTLGGLFVKAFPLGVLGSFNILAQQVPRYFIAAQLPIDALGIYAGIAQFAMLGAMIVNAIGQTIVGKLARLYRDDRKAFVAVQVRSISAGLVVGLAGIVLAWLYGPRILQLFYSSDFASAGELFVLGMTWSAVLYVSALTGSGMTGMRLFKEQSHIGGVVLLVTVGASYWLIDDFGLKGAFIALIVAAVIKLLLQVAVIAAAFNKVSQHAGSSS